jgi:hypothetical protein
VIKLGNPRTTTTGESPRKEGPLLSNTERDRLRHRPQEAKERASNDVRVRKKLRSWLQSLDDIGLICEYLPEDQISKEITDNHIFFLMGIAKTFMELRHFSPITGRLDNPDEWKIVTKTGAEFPANDIDIGRSLKLRHVINDIMEFHGQKNPVDAVDILSKLKSLPESQSRLTEADEKAIDRVTKAIIQSIIHGGSPEAYWDRYPPIEAKQK